MSSPRLVVSLSVRFSFFSLFFSLTYFLKAIIFAFFYSPSESVYLFIISFTSFSQLCLKTYFLSFACLSLISLLHIIYYSFSSLRPFNFPFLSSFTFHHNFLSLLALSCLHHCYQCYSVPFFNLSSL